MGTLTYFGDSDRRVFIKGLGYVSMGVLMAMMGGCESCVEQIENRPTRRRLRTGSTEVDEDIECYEDAVALMKALPASDPRSWDAQTGLHGSAASFNFCEHGTDHFFSWHRAYLAYFEQICQELTGNDDFGLPYWNWNQDPVMHAAFLDATSTLFHTRNSTSVAGSSAVSDGTLDTIFTDTNFFSFSSQVEGSPHNTVHVLVGADMVTGASPLDPIFWMHHCMVDYCWAKWNIELGNDNTSDTAWNDTTWTHFVDGNGDPVSPTAGATTLMPLLTYQYETSVVGSLPAAAPISQATMEFQQLEQRVRDGADIRFEVTERIPIADAAQITIAQPFSAETRATASNVERLLASDHAVERIFANVRYATLPPASDFFVRVFVNLPEASAATPTDDPHFAGSFAFFGSHHGGAPSHHGKRDFLVDVTPTLRRLRRMDRIASETPLTVQLVAVPAHREFAMAGGVLQLEGIELLITPVILSAK